MSRSIIARFRCQQAESTKEYDAIKLSAAYSSAPGSPNAQWSKWTPSGELSMTISNPPARGFFEAGEEYEILIQPARYTADEWSWYEDQARQAAKAAAASPDDEGLRRWAATARQQADRVGSRPA